MSTTVTQTQSSTFSLNTGASLTTTPVEGPLNFYVPPEDNSLPYNYVEEPPADTPRTNVRWETKTVPIHDMRGQESTFNIDQQAFLPIPAHNLTTNSTADFSSDDRVKQTYYPEVEELLLKTLPGSPNRVIIFDHTIRGPPTTAKREPVMRTHIDQTPESARERVHVHAPDEAEELLKGRVRLVNVWRPLNGPVESSPLAVADSSTVAEEQLVAIEHRYPHRTGYTAGVKHSENTNWWYWSGMTNEERLLLQCYDSETGTRVPHSAFALPGQEGRKHRESIEVRALIFG